MRELQRRICPDPYSGRDPREYCSFSSSADILVAGLKAVSFEIDRSHEASSGRVEFCSSVSQDKTCSKRSQNAFIKIFICRLGNGFELFLFFISVEINLRKNEIKS